MGRSRIEFVLERIVSALGRISDAPLSLLRHLGHTRTARSGGPDDSTSRPSHIIETSEIWTWDMVGVCRTSRAGNATRASGLWTVGHVVRRSPWGANASVFRWFFVGKVEMGAME